MISQALMTAEQFVEKRFDQPDGGRWAELVRGIVTSLQPPDESHGTIVLNLSKALGVYVPTVASGYACFELGVIIARNPDTVWQPAVSWFTEGERFAEVDKQVTDVVPSLVIEVVSTNDRRRGLVERIARWHEQGVQSVWIIDPVAKAVHVQPARRPATQVSGNGVLQGDAILPGFALPLANLFAEPEWWRDTKKK